MNTTEPSRLPRPTVDQLIQLRWQQALADNNNNQTHTAKELGISIRTLQRWIHEAANEAKATNASLAEVAKSLQPLQLETVAT